MPLLLTGQGFRKDLERNGALALYAPLEGGAETRLMRRLRAAGYKAVLTSARGLGEPENYLMNTHVQQLPHLGRRMNMERRGDRLVRGLKKEVMPLLGPTLAGTSPVLLWLLEGQVLSLSEIGSLIGLTTSEPRLKIVVEMGGARSLKWHPLSKLVAN